MHRKINSQINEFIFFSFSGACESAAKLIWLTGSDVQIFREVLRNMKLCLELESSHDLHSKVGWNDLQLCTNNFIVLRNTAAQGKRCFHYIDRMGNKFVYKIDSSISSLVKSMLYTSASKSGEFMRLKIYEMKWDGLDALKLACWTQVESYVEFLSGEFV